MFQPITVKGVTIRRFRKSDAPSLQKNLNNKNVSKWLTGVKYPYDLQDARNWIELSTKCHKQKKPEKLPLCIVQDGEVIGGCGYTNIANFKTEIGYWLAPEYWGQGIMTAVTKELTRYGFATLKFRRIGINAFIDNKASRRVAEKCGYTFEGILRKYYEKDGKLQDAAVYSRIR